MLTLRQLQYFVALTELRHFGKAAERCCVTQPALSMQIKELEDELGVCLLSRKRGSLELTPDGRDIAARAQLAGVHGPGALPVLEDHGPVRAPPRHRRPDFVVHGQ